MISILPAATARGRTRQHVGADEVLDRRRGIGEGAEHQAVQRRHAQLARPVIFHPEAWRHAALAVHPALERDRAADCRAGRSATRGKRTGSPSRRAPALSRQISAPRCAQRFSNAAIEPSASRATTTGMCPTTVVRQSPGSAISLSRHRKFHTAPSNTRSCSDFQQVFVAIDPERHVRHVAAPDPPRLGVRAEWYGIRHANYSAALRAASRSISACTAAADWPVNSSW